ncbi:MAG: hypothetical protein AB7O80_26435 [Acetobacteraceae bacterium]
MRACLAVLLLLSAPALAQGVSAGEAMALYQALTPQQRQMLVAGALRGRDSLSAADAMAWYQSMTPQQKAQAKEWVRQQGGAAALKETAKRMLGR